MDDCVRSESIVFATGIALRNLLSLLEDMGNTISFIFLSDYKELLWNHAKTLIVGKLP